VRHAPLALLAALALAVSAAPASAAVSFTDVEDEVMCTVCGTPLNLAPLDAPFAERQRAYIRRLIAEGRSKQQIKDALVAQYGDEVLALPEDDGFNLVAYIAPIAIILAAAGLLFFAFGNPRRRQRPAPAPEADLPAADARRLDEDLARYD
jgi:cytochrome c-type biogenesis protein CcmH/NrfF